MRAVNLTLQNEDCTKTREVPLVTRGQTEV
jgi:hypothetical protein